MKARLSSSNNPPEMKNAKVSPNPLLRWAVFQLHKIRRSLIDQTQSQMAAISQ